MFSPQASISGTSRLYEPVISLTITIEVSGVLETPAKKPPIPTSTKAAGSICAWGTQDARNCPQAPPSMPPMSIDGPNTPPLPPELIVRPVATILRTARVSSSPIPMWGRKLSSPGRVSDGGIPIAPHCTQP